MIFHFITSVRLHNFNWARTLRKWVNWYPPSSSYFSFCVQKKKAEGPTDPQQPAKKIKAAKEEVVVPVSTPTSNLSAPDPVVMATGGSTDADKLKAEIDAQGAKVREIKGTGADKVRLFLWNGDVMW